jgi:type IV pilus assembly protein PilV
MILAGNRIATQSGTGMIEVLVAIAIVAFAMFALIGIQTVSLRYQKAAHSRAVASEFSADLADRVRANISGAHSGAYNLSQQIYPAFQDSPPSCFNPANCAPQEVAAKDLHEWRAGLSKALPGGWGEIAGSVADGFTIKVYFLDRHAAGDELGKLKPVAKNCRPSAAASISHKDVHCFATAFSP